MACLFGQLIAASVAIVILVFIRLVWGICTDHACTVYLILIYLFMYLFIYVFIYLCIYLLKAYSPVNRTGSRQGFRVTYNTCIKPWSKQYFIQTVL